MYSHDETGEKRDRNKKLNTSISTPKAFVFGAVRRRAETSCPRDIWTQPRTYARGDGFPVIFHRRRQITLYEACFELKRKHDDNR